MSVPLSVDHTPDWGSSLRDTCFSVVALRDTRIGGAVQVDLVERSIVQRHPAVGSRLGGHDWAKLIDGHPAVGVGSATKGYPTSRAPLSRL